jgi:ribosomal protein S18 acetylase RimI-like enzyme
MNADRAEAAFWAAFLRNRNVDAASAGDGAVAVAGGYALCVPGTMLEYAVGAGSTRPLRADDCEVVESFYAARRLPARLELNEDVLERDEALLRERGYADEGVVLAQLEAPLVPAPPANGAIAVRTTTDRRTWTDLLVRSADAFPDPAVVLRSLQINAAAAQVLVIASYGGEDAGAAALGISGEWAVLYSGGVLPAFRERGIHGELVRARLALAHARGAAAATLKTAADSPAEHSARRHGFERTALRRRTRRDA